MDYSFLPAHIVQAIAVDMHLIRHRNVGFGYHKLHPYDAMRRENVALAFLVWDNCDNDEQDFGVDVSKELIRNLICHARVLDECAPLLEAAAALLRAYITYGSAEACTSEMFDLRDEWNKLDW